MDEFKSMGDAVKEMFKDNKSLRRNEQQFELKEIVKQVLGEKLLQYITEIKIQEKNIIIRTDISVLKHEIKLLEKPFIERINEVAQKIVVEKITIL